MELNDSIGELRDLNELGATRSGLGIDLNEIPSPSFIETLPDSVDIVRTYHENPPPPPGGPAGIPGEGRVAACAVCAKPEVRGHVLVCDGCERGYHLSCVGMRCRQPLCLDEWLCGECLSNGVKSKRWPLGVKSKQILDINASPPSDWDGDVNEDLWELRKHTLDGNSFGANPFGAPVTCSKFSNGYVTHAVKLGFEDILNRTSTEGRSLEEADMNFSMGKHRSSNNTAVRCPHRTTSEIFLQALKEFVADRNGVLEEGWHVDVRQSLNSSDVYAVYCAPDGKLFDSVFEVASYLGLMSNNNYAEPAVRNERSILKMEGSHISRKRKSARFAVPNGSVESNDALVSGYCKESSANGGRMECPNAGESTSKVSETVLNDGDTSGYQHVEDGFPLQFADFFVISMGKIDAKRSYSDVDIIWPVGYKSCWHDKITGSIFTCEVLDGGVSGPLFKVKRRSCCETPVPVGSTILSLAKPTELVHQTNGEDQLRSHNEWDGDSTIQMILSDLCLPVDNDIFSCLTSPSNKASDSQPQELLQPAPTLVQNKAEIFMHNEREQTDEIGEISAEECSSSLAWKLLSKRIVDVCTEIYKQKGTLKFFCKHAESGKCQLKWDIENSNSNSNSLSASFAKFYGSPGFTRIPSIVQLDYELDAAVEAISKWLDQDRFGLDMAFVQEILERQLGAQDHHRYQLLNTRSDYSASWTVSNGFLVMETTGQLQYNEEGASNGLCGALKRARLAEEPNISDRCPPQGKPVCSRVPSELVGDVFQAWELLCRFQETLDLKESVSLYDLEEELMSPWFDGMKSRGKFEIETQGRPDSSLQGVDSGEETILSVSSKSETKISQGNPHAFIPMETEAMKEEAQVKLASSTYSRCYGLALTKTHIALLGVLISELQTKVAALVDPNFEPGESRPKRGRKKDIDPTISSKRSKLNMLPVNELTWPELARRYVLAVLSMDGNLDSAEITARESGKVFRCLRGDGGLLCGSLTGIAGMEADALLLAEATKHIFGSITKESEVLTIEDEGSEGRSVSDQNLVINGDIPEWAKSLEPVRKLPTNVGTRIRKCVYEALDKNPPEWARKILEHSISKEVYKGNASGPTKKAVLSVLGTVCQGGSEQKPAKATKRKIVISVSDIIMKQCRIVLRRAAAADDAKIFCNLLGRKLINSCDNDDEGLLGSPAMVSRPLDFRTIDLRLATGAYGGSHEAFLEDARELWNNLRIAYGDQPDLAELADKLSDNFESLYENEVVRYVHKFVDFAKVECLSAEMRKELDELTVSMSEIPKAPWDDGVCKVCGVDKDDDSVLLCDTCDAEYHTYCLNPPLVRIPEGNWYCPSCVVSKHMVQDVSGRQQVVAQRRAKKFREVTSAYLEALAHLSAVMEEKEYWEYSPSERAFLLKFLCDELLNSTLIRQHLEQCAEMSSDLNQKLRSFYFEWKNLKMKEDIISAKAARMESFPMSVAAEVGIKEGFSTSVTHSGKSLVQQHSLSDKSNHFVVLPESHASQEAGKEKSTIDSVDDAILVTKSDADGRHTNPIVVGQMMDASAASDGNKPSLNLTSIDTDVPNKSSQSILSNDVGALGPRNESDSYRLELNAIKNDISLLQDSIMTVESQLFKLSVRREFMGIDSIGRLYWASAMPGGCPCIIVDATAAMMHEGKSANRNDIRSKFPFLQNDAPFKGTCSLPMVPKAGTSCGRNNALSLSSPCISYHTDADVDILVDWLRYNDPKEREPRESIIHWKKVKFQETSHMRSQTQKEQHVGSSIPINIENVHNSCLVAKATSFLEKKYGRCMEFDSIDISKKWSRKAKEINEEKPYRCECLELIWPSRQHCLHCHRTFLSNVELEGHNEGKCSLIPSVSEKSKDNNELSRVKESKTNETIRDGCRSDADTGTTPKAGSPELSPGLIRFQNEDQLCPYNFDDICSKFLTNDSNRELVNEIGLIGSGGVPSFVPTVSPFVSDSMLMLVTSQEDAGFTGKGSKSLDWKISQVTSNVTHSLDKEIAEKTSADETIKSGRSAKPTFVGQTRDLGDGRCCVVPVSSLRPLVGKVSHISRQLKINLLDMEAALPDDALRPSKAQLERRWVWRAFVKSAGTIYEMVQATIILEEMIKTEYLRNDWWYWSSLSAAAKTSTLSSLALRIYSLDAAILYEKSISASAGTVSFEATSICKQKSSASVDVSEKSKASRKSSRKRKEPDG